MTNAERAAEEKRLEQRARRIGELDYTTTTLKVVAFLDGPKWLVSGSGRTRLAALRDLMRRVDRFADRVVKSREGQR